jgi:hypothetical protein
MTSAAWPAPAADAQAVLDPNKAGSIAGAVPNKTRAQTTATERAVLRIYAHAGVTGASLTTAPLNGKAL